MHPVALRLGPIAVYTYPLALLAALAIAWALARAYAPRAGLPRAAAVDLVLAAALGGLVGARLLHVATFPQLYAEHWWRVFELQTGGLVFYGGVAGAALAVAALARARGLPLPAVADIGALALPAASAVGRLGCLAAGCCGGPGLRVGTLAVPPQLLDAAVQASLFGVLAVLAARTPLGRGRIAWWWLALYGAGRFGIEYVRAEEPLAFGATQAQLLSVAAMLAGIAGLAGARAEGGAR